MSSLKEFRKRKDTFFEQDPHSPLSKEQRSSFQGLDYYPEDPDLRFVIKAEPFEEQEQVQIQTSTGDVGTFLKYGVVKFEIDDETARLVLFIGQDGNAFIPFLDQTSGEETYGAGRYLDPHALGDGKFLVDFNLAYNPWCAYSPLYSCPLPPKENQLSIPIRAGEKDYQD